MMKRTLGAALAAAFLATGAASVQAQKKPNPTGNTIQVTVINNYSAPVRVYAEDVYGRIQPLGWVNRSVNKVLSVPAEMGKHGAVRIRIYSDRPIWSPRDAVEPIKTMPLNLKAGDEVDFWVERELTESFLQIVRT